MEDFFSGVVLLFKTVIITTILMLFFSWLFGEVGESMALIFGGLYYICSLTVWIFSPIKK